MSFHSKTDIQKYDYSNTDKAKIEEDDFEESNSSSSEPSKEHRAKSKVDINIVQDNLEHKTADLKNATQAYKKQKSSNRSK